MSMKVSFSLLFILVTPTLINIDWILDFWLKKVPDYSNVFVIIIGLCTIFVGISNPLAVVAEAANRLKLYNLVTMPFYLSTIPIAYFLLKADNPAYVVFVVTLISESVGFFVKLFIANNIINLSIRRMSLLFVRFVLCIMFVSILGYFSVDVNLHSLGMSVLKFIFFFLIALFIVMYFVLNKNERRNIYKKIIKR